MLACDVSRLRRATQIIWIQRTLAVQTAQPNWQTKDTPTSKRVTPARIRRGSTWLSSMPVSDVRLVAVDLYESNVPRWLRRSLLVMKSSTLCTGIDEPSKRELQSTAADVVHGAEGLVYGISRSSESSVNLQCKRVFSSWRLAKPASATNRWSV